MQDIDAVQVDDDDNAMQDDVDALQDADDDNNHEREISGEDTWQLNGSNGEELLLHTIVVVFGSLREWGFYITIVLVTNTTGGYCGAYLIRSAT